MSVARTAPRLNESPGEPGIHTDLQRPVTRTCVSNVTSIDIRTPLARRCHKAGFLRKEVIQPQVPLRLPCYDFTPVAHQTLGACSPKVSSATSGTADSRGVTGGVYKARERIHRGVLIHDY